MAAAPIPSVFDMTGSDLPQNPVMINLVKAALKNPLGTFLGVCVLGVCGLCMAVDVLCIC